MTIKIWVRPLVIQLNLSRTKLGQPLKGPIAIQYDWNNVVDVFGVNISGPSHVMYDPNPPMPHEPRIWVQTDGPYELLTEAPHIPVREWNR